MQTPNNDLKEHLTRCRQIKISVIGRKSGKTISIPVWFVLEGEKLSLLPVRGRDAWVGLSPDLKTITSEPWLVWQFFN
jgi:hypothetical protein